jgi:hypothetical protein
MACSANIVRGEAKNSNTVYDFLNVGVHLTTADHCRSMFTWKNYKEK